MMVKEEYERKRVYRESEVEDELEGEFSKLFKEDITEDYEARTNKG